MNHALRAFVWERAGGRCEYCRLPQSAVDATFHVDHVVAQQHLDAVSDDPASLALACDRCNFCKGTNLSSVDPESQAIVPLYDPRRDDWSVHFALDGAKIIGATPTGRATARLLQMNARHRVELRQWLIDEGAFDDS